MAGVTSASQRRPSTVPAAGCKLGINQKGQHTMTNRIVSATKHRLRLLAVPVLLAGGMTAAASAASADGEPAGIVSGTGTITYISKYNVFVARQDGTGPRQVTTDGTASSPYYSPTQSDSGQIVAGRGNLIQRMDQWGKVLNSIDPPDLRSGGNQTLGGRPTSLAVSPDGSKIAFTYAQFYCSFPNNVCKTWPVTGFMSSMGSTATMLGTTYGDNPSWVTNSRVVADSRSPFDNIYLYDVGVGTVGNYWFGDENLRPTGYTVIGDIEISRNAPYAIGVQNTLDQTRAAFIYVGDLGNYRTGQPVSPDKTNGMCASTTVPGIDSATWSADGATAAWQEGGSVVMAAMGDAPCESEPVVAIPGGTAPSFSPAALQTTDPNPGTPTPTTPVPTTPAPTKPAPTVTPPAQPVTFQVKSAAKVAGTAKVGKKIKAVAAKLVPSATTVKYQWFRDKKAIKGATKSSYRVTKSDRRHTLRVRTTSIRAGYKRVISTSKAVKVKS
jgi:hypothetical protein